MSIYPGAVFKPTGFGGRTLRNRQGRGILHVAVSGARSLPPWNQNTWHFYVAKDGYCEQYVDTEYRGYASGDANDDAIHIETAGGLGSSAVLNAELWTPAQAARIADIMRWEASQPGGAPLELLPDSKAGRRGWGPHRLGVTHSRGLGAVPGWRVPGGESWSSAVGKECPGDAKIRQIPQLIEMARTGATALEDDMPDMNTFLNTPAYTGGPTISTVLKELDVRTRAVDVRGPDGKATGKKIGLPELLSWFDNNMAAIRAAAADVADPQQFADTLRPLLLEVAQTAAASARAGADSGDAERIADRVVDEMVTRMARPTNNQP